MNFSKRIQSFRFAFNGFTKAYKNEANLRVHSFAAIVVCILGYFFGLTKFEWVIIILCISSVISLELLNTAIEELCDKYSLEIDPKLAYIKDLSAAAVLISSIAAALIGIIIFTAKLL